MYNKAVEQFHEAFSIPVESNPCIPSKERCLLRIKLMREELDEFEEALLSGNLEHAAKELTDCQYVLSGTVLEMGLGSVFDNCFNETHRSNMSKIVTDWELARDMAVDEGTAIEVEGGWIVKNKDGKVLKGLNYSRADLSGILAK